MKSEEGEAVRGVRRWEGGEHGAFVDAWDELSEESPLEIRVRGRAVAVTMRTPGHDEELTLGFLASEGIVRGRGDVVRIEPCGREDANVVNAVLRADLAVDFERLTRHVFASSSCGVCGRATIDALRHQFDRLGEDLRVSPAAVLAMPGRMRAAQAAFERTGGLHAAALFDERGEMVVLREDVGRHNAVDKVLGWAMTGARWPVGRFALMVSGRTSFEIVQKALAGGVQVVAAVSAPSSLAVDLAREAGLTLLGFVRDGRFNVYSGAGRVASAP